ncbi:hypothetical protein T492DRAFT_844580 [Pavlovales sp. CCMP2436]|nr:hypothetical protein T492DRAFT_844580 [Pavlovales sp. CCMP2436]
MTSTVAYASFTQSYGHCALSFDIPTGKYVASFIVSTDYGVYNNGIYYEVDRYSGSNASKNNFGLNVRTAINPFWNLNMPARPFPNVAQMVYICDGIVIDASKRITVEILATGSHRTNASQIKYDITRFVDEQNIGTLPYDHAAIYTYIS